VQLVVIQTSIKETWFQTLQQPKQSQPLGVRMLQRSMHCELDWQAASLWGKSPVMQAGS